jgi:thioesterase domain-containing protein
VWYAFVRDVAGAAGVEPPDLDLGACKTLDRDAMEELALDALDKAGLAPADLRDDLRVRMQVVAANMRALYEYRPPTYNGRVVLVRAEEESVASAELAGWQDASPHLEQRSVPGDHYTLLEPPQLSVLATVLREVLEESGNTGEAGQR